MLSYHPQCTQAVYIQTVVLPLEFLKTSRMVLITLLVATFHLHLLLLANLKGSHVQYFPHRQPPSCQLLPHQLPYLLWHTRILMSNLPPFPAPSLLLPPRPSPRLPLQPLPASAVGNPTSPRPPTLRPLPSDDKENLDAVQDAIESQQLYRISRLEEIAHRLDLLRRAGIQALSAITMANSVSALPHTRLSMPEISDDSESEPDVSILGMARERLRARESGNRPTGIPHGLNMAPEHLQAHDTSVEDEDEDLETVDDEEDEDEEDHDAEQEADEPVPLIDPATMGLKEISNLGRFTVSSHKQGNGVEELRNDDLNLYWQ